MTIKQLLEKTAASVYIVDGSQRHYVTPWNMIYNMFADCVIDTIEPGAAGDALEITLKTELVRESD